MSIAAFTKLISEYEGYPDEAIIRIECSVKELRALSSPPSVTEEWVDKLARENLVRRDAIRATLAALGITVEGAAK